jgi:hypothetical protein
VATPPTLTAPNDDACRIAQIDMARRIVDERGIAARAALNRCSPYSSRRSIHAKLVRSSTLAPEETVVIDEPSPIERSKPVQSPVPERAEHPPDANHDHHPVVNAHSLLRLASIERAHRRHQHLLRPCLRLTDVSPRYIETFPFMYARSVYPFGEGCDTWS